MCDALPTVIHSIFDATDAVRMRSTVRSLGVPDDSIVDTHLTLFNIANLSGVAAAQPHAVFFVVHARAVPSLRRDRRALHNAAQVLRTHPDWGAISAGMLVVSALRGIRLGPWRTSVSPYVRRKASLSDDGTFALLATAQTLRNLRACSSATGALPSKPAADCAALPLLRKYVTYPALFQPPPTGRLHESSLTGCAKHVGCLASDCRSVFAFVELRQEYRVLCIVVVVVLVRVIRAWRASRRRPHTCS